MRLAAAVVALVAMSSGCMMLSRTTGKVLTVTGLGLTAAGGIGAALSEQPGPIVGYVVVPGVVLLALGLFLIVENPSQDHAYPRSAEDIARHEDYLRAVKQQREAAWALTKEAAAAAREGNCARVLEIDANVKLMDAELHASAFVRDVAILRCLPLP